MIERMRRSPKGRDQDDPWGGDKNPLLEDIINRVGLGYIF